MRHIVAWDRMALLLEKHRALVPLAADLAVLGARDSDEVLALHREHRARLLIFDTRMPGTPLEEICRAVRADEQLRQVSVIVIGSAAAVPAMNRCGANRCFVRPVDQEDFLGAVRSLVNVAARKNYRVLVGVQVSGVIRTAPFFGKSENISLTGILFATNRQLSLGDRPELNFVLPGQGQLHVRAEITRKEALPDKGFRFGARFVDPDRRAHGMLEAFLRARLA